MGQTIETGEDLWFEYASSLSLPWYKRFMKGVIARYMNPMRVSSSLVYYAKKKLRCQVIKMETHQNQIFLKLIKGI